MALSTQDFNRFLQEASSYTGFGMKKYDELKALGATDKQIQEIAARAPIVGDAVAGMFPELTSWGVETRGGMLSGVNARLKESQIDYSVIPPGFDWEAYVRSNPDLIQQNIDTAEEAKRHYALFGYQENRPNAPAPLPGRDERYQTIRNELETQYNNLVSIGQQQGKDLSYQGRKSDLPAIFNQQAAQLADAGVTSIANLRQGSEDVRTGERFGSIVVGKNPILIDSVTGKKVSTTNLGGSIATDRDTGAQKFGDIFSGVEGGANYGIQFAPDGSPIMFPVYEKTKSPIAQLGLDGLEDVIGPVLTTAGAYYGMPGLGAVGGAAAGAAAGNTVGQLLASGDVDWGQVATSAALAGGASYLSGAGGAGTADLSGTTTGGMLGSDAGFAVSQGAGSAAGAGGGLLGDASFIAQDAAGMASQGLNAGQITQNLVAAGVDPGSAQLAANLATSGTGASSIANTLASMAPTGTTGLFGATAADLAAAGITTGGTGVGLTQQQLQAIQAGRVAGSTFAEQAANAQAMFPGTTGIPGAGGMGGNVATGALSDIFGAGGIGGFLTGLAGAGIDYAALQAISDEAKTLGRETEQRATAAGAASNVPFTPYTVTTGAGTTAFGGTREAPTATVTASPEFQTLRNQALGQAGATLGAINPAQAAESLFQRSEALAAPARQRETEQLLSSLGARGLLGLSTNVPTVGGTVAGVNPFVESLASAQRTAQARSALESTQFGTAEAQRQAALANALIGTGQNIDTQALQTLTQGANLGQFATAADQTSAANQLRATLAGQALRQQYEDLGLRAQTQGYLGAADFGRGMLGLPTQAGNTASTNIVGNLLNRGFDYIFS